MSTAPLPDLVKTVIVPARPDRAFAVFVEEVGAWWPLAGFSVGGASSSVAFERDPDGRATHLVETLADRGTAVWGAVTRWDPPHALAFTWHPGERADAATRVEVTFTPDGDATAVVLTHSGWEARADGEGARTRYDTGWELVLKPFAEHAGSSR
ncbi:SRPBCC domain-containing protein [Cellulosimicrobium sp. PMB13]|uniref:SRPBCC domain-containing protein n=1 Tax=Cellulosimicrobium sp. PMB13 TaxID=3120158 RepID=UPI003F4C4CF8